MDDLIVFNLDVTTNTRCKDCWNLFLDALKYNFKEFALEQNNVLYFQQPQPRIDEVTGDELPPISEADVQAWIDSFDCNLEAEFLYQKEMDFTVDAVMRVADPTISENLDKDILWVNKKTGDIFTCIDNTPDKNIWIGTKSGRIIRPIPPADRIDFFGDKSSVGFYPLYKDATDLTGRYHGKPSSIIWEPLFDKSVANSSRNGTIKIYNLPFNSSTEEVTISSWAYWNGTNSTMPYGWTRYDIYCYNGILGFNTAQGDVTGLDFTPYKNKWVYLTVVFRKGTVGEIFVNGVQQTLDKKIRYFSSSTSVMDSTFTIFGWKYGVSYRRFGKIGRLRIFDRALTPQEVGMLTQAEVEFILSIGGKL